MNSASVDIILLDVVDDFEDEINKIAKDALAESLYHYIQRAGIAVPVWTGYSRAIWNGIAEKARDLFPDHIFPEQDLHEAREWFYPKQPASNPSSNVYEDPEYQILRGEEDGYGALELNELPDSISIFINIPTYNGEVNYDIREHEWRSLAAGDIAFQESFDHFTADVQNRLMVERRIS